MPPFFSRQDLGETLGKGGLSIKGQDAVTDDNQRDHAQGGEGAFRLRSLADKDIDAAAHFEFEITNISFEEDPIVDPAFSRNKVRRLIGADDVAPFVAETDSSIIGWPYVSIRRNYPNKEPYADLQSVFVAPSARRTGLVASLIEAVCECCADRRLDRAVIWTRASNEPMKAVLDRFGFQPMQIRPIDLETTAGSDNAGGR